LQSYKRFYCILFFTIATVLGLQAQQKELDNGKRYTLRDITVSGTQSFNENTVVAFTGLKPGDRLYIPGEKLSAVTKRLWEQNLFSDIAFYVTAIDGDEIDLELYIVELPKLNSVSIEGLRKGLKKDIIEDNNLVPGIKITKNLIANVKNYIKNTHKGKGFLNTQVIISTNSIADSTGNGTNHNMKIIVDRGKRVKVKSIKFENNEELTSGKLRSAMKNTQQAPPYRVWKMSKYTESGFEEDK
jgi:outer membrane protein insertion porin family